MKGSSLTVVGGSIVTPDSIYKGDIRIVDGKIVEMGTQISSKEGRVIDASGLFILPGVIDSHVHFRDPGLTESEDFRTGTEAAAAGGVTTILEMPNTSPPVDTASKLQAKRAEVMSKAVVDFGLYGVLHDANLGEVQQLIESGAVGLKAFLGPTTGNIPPPSDATIYEALILSKKMGFPVAFHAENAAMVSYYTEAVRKTGRVDPMTHCEARPSICESEAINRIGFLTLQSGGHGHIVHMSTGDGAKIVSEYKKLGAPLTCETNPQYLAMTEEDQVKHGSIAKINPPLRTARDQTLLWDGIRTGIIDTLGSDHAPHPADRKRSTNIWDAPSGFIGVETLVPIMLDFAANGKITLQKISLLLSQNVAKLYKLWPGKGRIGLDADGDLTIVELGEEHVIRGQELHSKQKVTPFEGRRVEGAVKYTVVRGNLVYDGQVGKPAGEWLRPVTDSR